MSTYLERNPPRTWQMGPTINGAPVTSSPTCVLHTYEADWPASQGAQYIATRSNSAGYHHLTGLDQSIQMSPWSYGTAHAIPVNVWAKGFSAMWFAGRWGQLSEANRRTLVHGMAKGVYEYSQWRVRNGMSAIRPRKISRAQAMRGENGIVYHGDLQSDRTDPGKDFPLQMFLTELRRLQSGGATPAAPPVLEGEVMTTAKDVWSYANTDLDSRQVFRMLRNVAQDTWNERRKPLKALTNRWEGLRKDGYQAASWVQYAYLQARMARQNSAEAYYEAREIKAMVRAMAKAQDELLQGQGKILKAVEDAEQMVVKANAAEVAAELEVTVKEDQEDD